MGRTHLAGAIAIDKQRAAAAKAVPFLGLYVENWRKALVMKDHSLAKLGLVSERYDDARGIWFFAIEMHDDDLWNAKFEPLYAFLKTMPATPGSGFVASRDDWRDRPSWFVGFAAGHLIEAHDDGAAFDAQLAKVEWPTAHEVFASLQRQVGAT